MTISKSRLEKCRRARKSFEDAGIDITKWAENEGFNVTSVYAVLSGRNKGVRGQAHQIAVKLGIKKQQDLQIGLGGEQMKTYP